MMQIISIFVFSALLGFSVVASAEWKTDGPSPLGSGWRVTNGDLTIHGENEKHAKKMVRILNRAEKKAEKEEKKKKDKGFRDDDPGLCDQPGVVC